MDYRKKLKEKFGVILEKFSISNFLMLFIAGCINSFGVTVLLMPVKLYDSGISGTSMLLSQLTPPQLTLTDLNVRGSYSLFTRFLLSQFTLLLPG